MNISLPLIKTNILKIFFITVFFVYYETRLIPGTLHGWVLIFGFMLTLPTVLQNFKNSHGKLPLDYTILAFLSLIYISGFLVNFADARLIHLQAYLLTIVCYVFVRENVSAVPMSFFFLLVRYFLLCNGLLVILQFVTGEFYPARYLAAGDPPLQIPSGVSDGPTKNGMLISFALSFMFARLLWAKTRASCLDIGILMVGAMSLALAASRAGLLSFFVVLVLGSLFAVFNRKKYRLNLKNVAFVTFIFLIPMVAIYFSNFGLETLAGIRDPDIDKYGGSTVLYKLTIPTGEDSSVAQRFGAFDNSLRIIGDSPLSFFSVGIGLGSYQTLHEEFGFDSNYVEILLETGAYGFLAFLFVTAYVVRKALSHRDPIEILPVLFALVSVMVFMAFQDVLRGRIFWIALAILASFAYAKTDIKKAFKETTSLRRVSG